MNKTGIMYGFLVLLIIGILFAWFAVNLGNKVYGSSINSKESESFNKLVELTNSIEKDEIISTVLYMNKKSVIVGFAKDAPRFENHEYFYGREDPDVIMSIFVKPLYCEEGKACICICQGYELNMKSEPKTIGGKPYTPECKEKITCKPIENKNIDILPEKVVRMYGNGKPRNIWKGGFLFGRDVVSAANGLEKNYKASRVLYMQRYTNIVDFCFESPCITEEIKEQIGNLEINAIEEFPE